MKVCKLKDICSKGSSNLRQKDVEGKEGVYPVYGASGIISKTDIYHQENEYIAIVKDGSGIGRVSFMPPKSSVIATMQYILPKEGYDIRYIGYCLQSLDLSKYKQGAAIPHIYFRDYGERNIRVCENISEQHRIVSYLDTTFANIDKLKDKAATALTEAKALFQAALTEAMKPKEGWEEKTLGEICTIVGRIGFRGYTRKDIVSDKKDGAITLSPSNIVDGKMSYLNCTYISWYKYEESPEIKIYEGDILMVKTGSSYGKTAYVDYLPHKATINPQFVVLKDVKINKKYLSYHLKTKNTFDYIKSIVSGSAIPTFSQANLAKMELTVPPLSLQEQIVTRLDTLSSNIRKLEENYRKTLEECDALKQAVLREVFE